MKLHEWASAERGRALRLATHLGVTPPVVSDWCTGEKQVPLDRCVAIERFTEGVVTCEELRPDKALDFAYLRGAQAIEPSRPEPAPQSVAPAGA